MSIWGRLADAAAGFGVGGPLGAVVSGHPVVDWDSEPAQPDKHLAFTIGVISLGAKMAKVDGHVTKGEVEAFKEVFRVPDSELQNVARIFDRAKQHVAGFEAYAEQLAGLFRDDREMLHNILEGLFYIAETGRVLQTTERDYLATVARLFGIGDAEFGTILARHYAAERDGPYQVLGVSPDMRDDDLHSHYRKLMVQNHPDKLMSRGLPQEMVDIANRKIAAMNGAYDEIRRARLAGVRV